MTTAGVGSWMGWVHEAVWGTSVARTKYVPLLASGDNLGADIEKVMSQNIEVPQTLIDQVYAGQQAIRGSVEIELAYTGQLRLWQHLSGSDPAPTGVGPFVWSFARPIAGASPDTDGKGLSIEILRGEAQANSFLYEGCKITKVTVTQPENGVAKVNFEFLAKQVTSLAKSVPGTIGVNDLVYAPTGQATPSFCLIDAAAQVCKGLTFSADNKYETRFPLDSKLTLEPYRSAKQETTMQLELEFATFDEFDDFLTTTERTLILEWELAANANFRISMQHALLMTGATPFVNSMGVITYSPTYRGFYQGGDKEYVIRITNDEATMT